LDSARDQISREMSDMETEIVLKIVDVLYQTQLTGLEKIKV